MNIPLQVTFSNMTPSDALRSRIETLVARLDRFHERIMSCRVVVRAPNHRRRAGKFYHVRIDLTLPGREIAINRDPPQDHSHEDVYVAVRDAFNALVRQMEDAARKRRGDIKTRVAQPCGSVVQLFPEKNYGFLDDPEACEIYFHANSVPYDGFRRLKVGSKVHYRADSRENRRQATIVKPIGSSRTTSAHPEKDSSDDPGRRT